VDYAIHRSGIIGKTYSNIPVGQIALVYYFHNMRLLKHGLPGILSRIPRSDLPGSSLVERACSQIEQIGSSSLPSAFSRKPRFGASDKGQFTTPLLPCQGLVKTRYRV
jgi:hypothetical protein